MGSSSDDVVDENLRNTSDEDNGDTRVADATPSSSATSITAGSSSSLVTPSNCLNRMMNGHHHQPQKFFKTFLDSVSLAGVPLIRTGGVLASSVASRFFFFFLKADCDISGNVKNASFT